MTTELYNLQHTQLCNITERIFSTIKKHFVMMHKHSFLPLDVQVDVPPTLCAIQNFILIHDPRDYDEDKYIKQSDDIVQMEHGDLSVQRTAAETHRVVAARDAIPRAMLAQYKDHTGSA